MKWMLALGKALGLSFQEEKIDGLATEIEFLGLELDSIAMEARLPQAKLDILRDLLSSWQNKSYSSLTELQELTGYLQFVSQVIPTSRAFLHHAFHFMTSFTSAFSHRRIPKALHHDIEWWSSTALHWNGVHLISPSRESVHVYTDASGTKGIGGIFGSHWFSSHIPRRLSKRDI